MTQQQPLISNRYNRLYWTAVALLTVSSISAATLTLAFVRLSRADLYLSLAPLGVSLVIVLFSVWSSKVLIDEAQRRAHEQMELSKLRAELEVAQRIRELHHDLVNHLTAVSSWIQLGAGERAVRYIHKILSDLHPTKSATVAPEPHGLMLLLGMMGQKLAQAEQHGIALNVQLDSGWGAAGISDEVAIRVLGNLIDNAIAAAARREEPGRGRVEIAVAVEDETALFRVWNDGPAIPAALLQRLDGPPERTRPGSAQNNGLGLHIVRRLVDEAGGTMSVSSTSRAGTEFRVRFPINRT